jgi:hypothetical protein
LWVIESSTERLRIPRRVLVLYPHEAASGSLEEGVEQCTLTIRTAWWYCMSVAVAINIHKEGKMQICACLERIRRHLPNSSVAIFLNGELRLDLRGAFRDFGVEVFEGDNFANNQQWTLWWLRMLFWFQRSKQQVCLKLDPDTMVDAQPRYFPQAHYFGDVHTAMVRIQLNEYWYPSEMPFIQGGIVGLSINAVEKLIEAKLLHPPKYESWCPPISPDLIFMEDHLIAAALRQLDINPVQWPECKSLWKIPILNYPPQYSIVHPRYYPEPSIERMKDEIDS